MGDCACWIGALSASLQKQTLITLTWTTQFQMVQLQSKDTNTFKKSAIYIQDTDIGSHPVRVYFCNNSQPDCSQQHDPIQIRKGQLGNISLNIAVVGQIDNPLHEATIYSNFNNGNYICQNHIQSMDGSCSELSIAVFSFNDTEEIELSLSEGPCRIKSKSSA